jgi:DNA-binding XRE family transcriptional regulator
MNSDDLQLNFGHWLCQRRKVFYLTQLELAARVPCGKGTIRRIEAGDLCSSTAFTERLAAAPVAPCWLAPAAILLGTIKILRKSLHVPRFAAEQTIHNQAAASVRSLLDSRCWEQQWLTGHGLTIAELSQFVGACSVMTEATR